MPFGMTKKILDSRYSIRVLFTTWTVELDLVVFTLVKLVTFPRIKFYIYRKSLVLFYSKLPVY